MNLATGISSMEPANISEFITDDTIMDGNILNIEKVLREDLTINLELLEMALLSVTDNIVYIGNFEGYIKKRGISGKSKSIQEEWIFIDNFIFNAFEELHDGTEEVEVRWLIGYLQKDL